MGERMRAQEAQAQEREAPTTAQLEMLRAMVEELKVTKAEPLTRELAGPATASGSSGRNGPTAAHQYVEAQLR